MKQRHVISEQVRTSPNNSNERKRTPKLPKTGEIGQLPLCAKLTYQNTGIHTNNDCVQTCTNVYECVRAMFWAIFDRTDVKISLYRIVFRVEFEGDICFCLAPPKSMFFLVFHRFVRRFLQFFRFPSFCKNLVPQPSVWGF